MKVHVDFVVKSVGLPLFDVVKYPVLLLGCNLGKRLINSLVESNGCIDVRASAIVEKRHQFSSDCSSLSNFYGFLGQKGSSKGACILKVIRLLSNIFEKQIHK